jgi:hypothetical protein
MKQHITIEQLNDLSMTGKEKLREWWEPCVGDLFYDPELKEVYEYEDQRKTGVIFDWDVQPFEINGDLFESRGEDWNELTANLKSALPLLSIGQMIEFIIENSKEKTWVAYVLDSPYAYTWELADLLWEEVKEILQKS